MKRVTLPPHGVCVELPPVVLQSVGDTDYVSAGFETDGRLCGQQKTALQKQLLLLMKEKKQRNGMERAFLCF